MLVSSTYVRSKILVPWSVLMSQLTLRDPRQLAITANALIEPSRWIRGFASGFKTSRIGACEVWSQQVNQAGRASEHSGIGAAAHPYNYAPASFRPLPLDRVGSHQNGNACPPLPNSGAHVSRLEPL